MIEEIDIRDLGVIAEARLEPSPRFTAITGETGAGKTMLLTALDLLLGGRADPALVRAGAARAQVDGRFVGVAAPALERAQDAGAELDDGALLLARTVASQGRSRAHLGGRSVPAGVLAELSEHLVTVHGQADQLSLRSAARQREVVDAFAGADHAALLARVREAYTRVRQCEATLADAVASTRTRQIEIASLTAALAEIDDAAPQPGEDEELRTEADRLDNMEDLLLAVLAARAALSGSETASEDAPGELSGAVALLDRGAHALNRVGAHDPALASIAERLGESARLAADLDTELGALLSTLEADPERLEQVHARRARLASLARTYGAPFGEPEDDDPPPGSSDAVLRWAERARIRLADLTGPGHDVTALEEALLAARGAYDDLAARLTCQRRRAGDRLAKAVTAELTGLAMPEAQVTVAIEPAAPGPSGSDTVAILLTPHRGAPARGLGQGASGGELSRLMLALEVALASERPAGGPGATFVFDEIDAGIGGRTATQVGRRLADLARGAQVIVVTHLAQVAAFADTQLVVEKSTTARGTTTSVRLVEEGERSRELARMLSGETTEHALEHAVELLARAREQTQTPPSGPTEERP